MTEHIHLITHNEDGLTVKSIARNVMRVSATRFSHMKFNGGVLLDGAAAYANDIVREGRTLTLIERETPAYIPAPYERDVPVVYEDEQIYIIDKPAPMACQSGSQRLTDSLENAMAYRYASIPGFIFRPVNRLDKGTCGLMAAAKSGLAHALLQRQLHTGAFRRAYLAVTDGIPENRQGEIRLPIARAPDSTVKRAVAANGKAAVTRYRVLYHNGALALICLELETGRTHQIRVHLSALGCPVTGDYLYGKEHAALPGRFALHSAFIQLVHPMTGQTVTVRSALPKELAALF